MLQLLLNKYVIGAAAIVVILVGGYYYMEQRIRSEVEAATKAQQLKDYQTVRKKIDEAASVTRTYDDALERLRARKAAREKTK